MTEPNWIPLGAAAAGGAWMTGDTKISMQSASHDDPAGGRWLLADGSAIPAQYTALIAMAGANLPDAKGRTLVMLGTHADVNALNKNDGIALANRSPRHKSSVTEAAHGHVVVDPQHSHGGSTGNDTPDHTHNVGQVGGFGSGSYAAPYEAGGINNAYPSGGANSRHTHPINAGATGITINTNTTGLTVGPAASGMIDTPAYTVVGNLFIHT